MDSYTLVVVDMQTKFLAAQNLFVQEAVEREIKEAIRLNNPIVVLELVYEYNGEIDYMFGKTFWFITKYKETYNKIFIEHKNVCSGISPIKKLSSDGEIDKRCFRICGVNTDQCVEETTSDIHREFPNSVLQIVTKACNYDREYSYSDNPYEYFPKDERIKYV